MRRKLLIGGGYLAIAVFSTGIGMAATVGVRHLGAPIYRDPQTAHQGAWPKPTNIAMPPPGTPALFEAGRFAALRFQCRGG
jgi:hypothetical protein